MLTCLPRFACVLVLWVTCPTAALASDSGVLTLEGKVSLGAATGRIDHLAYDPTRQRLYVAELSNNWVGIVDLKARRWVRNATGFKEPQGVAYEPSTDTVYVASGDGSVHIFSGNDFAPVGQIDLGRDADNIRIDAATHRVYVGYGRGGLAVIDPVARKQVGTISLPGHPESFQLDPAGPRIFVNVPDSNAIAVVDRESSRELTSWSTDKLRGNFPLLFDAENGRVLAVFRKPARLQAFDVQSGKPAGGIETCSDADDVFRDAQRQRIYVVCGDGSVDVLGAHGGAYTEIGRFNTTSGSRTGLFVPELDRLLIAVTASRAEPAAVWILRPE